MKDHVVSPIKLGIAIFFLVVATLVSPACLMAVEPAAVPEQLPFYKYMQTLVASSDLPAGTYPGFPAILILKDEVLVSYKRGRSHASDPGAGLDLLRIDPAAQQVKAPTTLAQVDDEIMQMGEWVRFSNGDIANYIDVQKKLDSTKRLGLKFVHSTDGGRTFSPLQRFGEVDGVEYGYVFEAITEGSTTWMLAMSFSNLAGGRSVYPPRPAAGQVDVIRTDDNGKTWHFVRSLSRELGDLPINESSFIRHGDGFLVSARGYDNRQWLAQMDGEFRLQRKVDLTETYPFITNYVGRPRLFTRDGGWYLMGRNYTGVIKIPVVNDTEKFVVRGTKNDRMRLSMFKFDPKTLQITKHVLLDNPEGENVTDGYYAAPYWQTRDGRTYFNTVTYKRVGSRKPDIVRFEFDWDEVR